MIRLYEYEGAEYKDFSNDLFRRDEIINALDFEADRVTIEDKEYRLSNMMHLSVSGTAHNGIEITQFLGLKDKVKKGLLNLLNNC